DQRHSLPYSSPVRGPAEAPTVTSSEQSVAKRGDQDADAAGLAPDPMIDGASVGPVVVARVQLPVADHQLTVKQMKLLDSCMAVGRILGAGRQTHQHADAVLLRIRRQELAGDARRRLFPFRFGPFRR